MRHFCTICCFLISLCSYSQTPESNTQLFNDLNQLAWEPKWSPLDNTSWREYWTLDGYRAEVEGTAKGMLFCAGPVAYDNGSHAVLWTKESFDGAIKIEFDYTRIDDISRFVNIIYIQATGIGTPPFVEDIGEWNSLRMVPTMSPYFRHMNTYHISFAAFGVNNEDSDKDYVRARRYPVSPGGKFSTETALEPDYYNTGLFKPGVQYHMTIIKKDNHLIMQVKSNDAEKVFYWDTFQFPPIKLGKVGLRHMYTRCAIYDNFTIYRLPNDD